MAVGGPVDRRLVCDEDDDAGEDGGGDEMHDQRVMRTMKMVTVVIKMMK